MPNVPISIGRESWAADGPDDDPRGRLTASIRINGCEMHLEAYAVHTNDEGTQEFDVWPDECESIYHGVSAEGAWRTVEIDGREYALIASPYCD